ncbi:hypothetical protein DNJ95_18735 [Stutzerimonas kirkiae]|uniref:Uncharacterized protein n=1 Tax=Stutzerimonas kirkiae TaxID=2211392 RepID=A0A4Q9QVR1_9GAMM|nr:hypothetical protein DNJ96_18845 [Stutzerimonas kirkiae]TBU98033.1 hypothetical protein DNJ95_18735 [Stutzerimonas kirkiae]
MRHYTNRVRQPSPWQPDSNTIASAIPRAVQSEDGSVARAFYLECFDGNGSFTYDRIGRGTIYIKSCCLSLIISPDANSPTHY